MQEGSIGFVWGCDFFLEGPHASRVRGDRSVTCLAVYFDDLMCAKRARDACVLHPISNMTQDVNMIA